MQNWSWTKSVQKSNRNQFWEGLGLYLGEVWDALDRLLATFAGAFWSFGACSKSYLLKTMVQDGLQEAFWMAFGSILGGFGEDLDASWENLGIQN